VGKCRGRSCCLDYHTVDLEYKSIQGKAYLEGDKHHTPPHTHMAKHHACIIVWEHFHCRSCWFLTEGADKEDRIETLLSVGNRTGRSPSNVRMSSSSKVPAAVRNGDNRWRENKSESSLEVCIASHGQKQT
jgi:hypothetical protein